MLIRLLVFTAFALAISNATAANDPTAIRARGRLIVSVKNQGANAQSAHNDPAHFEKRGMELELAHALAARLLADPQKIELKMCVSRNGCRPSPTARSILVSRCCALPPTARRR